MCVCLSCIMCFCVTYSRSRAYAVRSFLAVMVFVFSSFGYLWRENIGGKNSTMNEFSGECIAFSVERDENNV